MICKICGAETKLIHNGTRDRADINVYECLQCHTKQLDVVGTNDYENGYMNEKLGMTSDEIKERLAECEKDDKRRAEYMKPFIHGKSILDFGCGFGGFLLKIQDIPKVSGGVELGHDERKYMESIGITCHVSIAEFNTKWDYITLFHVFEHLDKPLSWFRLLYDNLQDDGRIIIEVPNGNDALLSLYESGKFADFTYWSAHLFLYTIESLSDLIDKSGLFSIEKVEQIQRYPLANHLYWLSKGKPGGQNVWNFLDDEDINERYGKLLEKNNLCDTILFTLKKRNSTILNIANPKTISEYI